MYNEHDWGALVDATDELMATGRYATRSEAMSEARRLNPHLNATPPGVEPARAAVPRTGGNAEAELDRLARALQRERGGVTYAEAYARTLRANAALYVRYLAEQAARVGPGARHG